MTVVAGTIAISAVSMSRARVKLKELIPRGSHYSIEQVIVQYNDWYNGWANYFQMTNYPSQLKAIEAHARRRMRSRMIGDMGRPRHLVNRLSKMGMKPVTAGKLVYSNKGRWAMSGTILLGRTYSPEWFANRNFSTRSEATLSHWFDIKDWIKLT